VSRVWATDPNVQFRSWDPVSSKSLHA
jgi:hypothetical protein